MVLTDENVTTTFKFYQKNSNSPVSKEEYKAVVNAYTALIFEKVIGGDEVVLPAKVGDMFVKGTKRRIKRYGDRLSLPPDWKATKELRERDPEAARTKKVVYHTNDATNGVSYSFKWSKNRVALINKAFLFFRLVKDNKKILKRKIEQGQEYLIL